VRHDGLANSLRFDVGEERVNIKSGWSFCTRLGSCRSDRGEKGGTAKGAVLHIEIEEIGKTNVFKACDVQD
jgi:hypothetical protein